MTDPADVTAVELIWIEKRLERWVRFGRVRGETILDRRQRVFSFHADDVFAYVRWAAGDYGTVVSRLDVLRAVRAGEPLSTVGYVTPGAEILLRASGWPKVQAVLGHIDAIEALGLDPADVALDHWRHVHNRIAAHQAPRPYTRAQHRAWLQRRSLLP
jgi:hypothetical protein